MKARSIFLFTLSLFLLGSCGPSLRVYTDVDERADFGNYQSYNFMEYTEGNLKTIPGMELERIRVAFAKELESRGLEFKAEEADVNIRLTVLHRERIDTYYSYYYYPRSHHYLERAISLDMYENATRMHIWHGAAVGTLVSDPEKRKEQFPEIAAELMSRYPVSPPEPEAD